MRKRNEILFISILAGAGFYFSRDAFGGSSMDETPLTPWLPLLKKKAKQYSVPWRWLAAFVGQESSWGTDSRVKRGLANAKDVTSVSGDGKSYGLMQVIPTTADQMLGRMPGTTKFYELNDPEFNVNVGAKYVSYVRAKFPGVVQFKDGERAWTVRAYNGGPGFRSTVQGQADTPLYLSSWEKKLAQVMKWYPGNEMEI